MRVWGWVYARAFVGVCVCARPGRLCLPTSIGKATLWHAPTRPLALPRRPSHRTTLLNPPASSIWHGAFSGACEKSPALALLKKRSLGGPVSKPAACGTSGWSSQPQCDVTQPEQEMRAADSDAEMGAVALWVTVATVTSSSARAQRLWALAPNARDWGLQPPTSR